MITREHIEERISQLEAERVALIEQAQQQIAALDGALAALRQLLAADAADEPPPGHANGLPSVNGVALKEVALEE